MTDYLGDINSPLDTNFDDVYDFETLADRSEAQVRVGRVQIQPGKDDSRKSIHLTLEVLDSPKLESIHYYLPIPKPEEDMRTANRLKQKIKACYEACGCTPGDAPAVLMGREMWVIVGEEDDPKYGRRNTIKSCIVPK